MASRIRLEHASFRDELNAEFKRYLMTEAARFDRDECLRIDFHCHDHNSDVPDELWGRILGLPETWLKTGKLVKCLEKNGSDVVTVTNHNNARSCWKLLDKGIDVLVGAEFTCFFAEYELYLHVLTYGFTPSQEVVLNRLRGDIFDFLRYTAEHNIPVVLPHPLYFYTRNGGLRPELFEKLALMFQRFEVLNGHRDIWQSVLTLNWAQALSEDKLHRYRRKHKLDPADFGVSPHLPKVLTGGSDDHMGIFAGQCGSYLWVPKLQQRRQDTPLSELALDALRAGHVAPFGDVGENQKLTIALLDYFAQAATRIEDPGLLRMMFHRGEIEDKVACFAIANGLLEMKKHKKTQMFISSVHDALHGKKPDWLIRWNVPNDYRFAVTQLEKIADSRKEPSERFAAAVNDSINDLFIGLSHLMIKRLRGAAPAFADMLFDDLSTESLIRKFEIPSQLSALLFGAKSGFTGKAGGKKKKGGVNISELLDSLAFPALVSSVLVGAQAASARALYKNREFLNDFATHIGRGHHPQRALYLTDTLRDKNGVSSSLSGKLKEIQRKDLPVDFLICHPTAVPEPHLRVVRPLTEFSFPNLGEQEFRVPNLLEIAQVFYRGGYDRIICSTEGPMVLVALFLKYMFNVPAFFFMHTDWIDFIKHTTDLNQHERDRIRRLLRALYHQFDGVFVLNTEHREWLTGHQMGLPDEAVFLTAHHTEPAATHIAPMRKSDLIPGANANTPVLFVACRISKEKGVLELPEIYRKARQAIPDLKIVIAGSGPAEKELRKALPEATFLGWISRERLMQLYAGLDLFVFPSQFDTFGNVILEAFSQGMPVVAYNCKGPKDIIQNGRNGHLVNSIDEMAERIVQHFTDADWERDRHAAMRRDALKRVADYQAEPIMRQFLSDMGLELETPEMDQRSVA
jgi:glycosyltransferase involved in cell wall biosynthesis